MAITDWLTNRIKKSQNKDNNDAADHPKTWWKKWGNAVSLALVILFFIIYPQLVDDYWKDVAFYFGIYALLGLSLNIVLGEVGLFDLGHAAFYAIGAYATAILNTQLHIPILILLPISALVAGLFAFAVTSPVIHLKGDYLCVVTIGIGEIVRLAMINNLFGLTGGPNGVPGVQNPMIGSFVIRSSGQFYYYVWIVIGLVILGLIGLQHSRIGRAWNYIREDEIAAEATGIDVRSYKLLAFILGAALAGLAGNIYASKMMVVSPENFTFVESSLLFCIVLLGGLGSIPGTILGAAVISIFPEIFRSVANFRMLFFGAALMAMMIFRPAGVWPRRRGGINIMSSKAEREIERSFEAAPPEPALAHGQAAAVQGTAAESVLLETKRLTQRFGGLVAVNNFDLIVKQGKITSLIGPNGAGKTTVFNVVSGIYKPYGGSVIFGEKDITGLKPHNIAEAGIARTFQNIRLFSQLTCLENVMSGPHCHMNAGLVDSTFHTPMQRKEEKCILEQSAHRLNQVGLWQFRNELVKNLPYGKQKLLEIARALATNPKLLTLDEPSSGLNDAETEELIEFLQVLVKEGFTLLLIEHDMNLVMGISDWITVMDMGSKIAEGIPQEIYNNQRVIEAYLGKEDEE
jgi:branched-chain amino acid transport system permease protein